MVGLKCFPKPIFKSYAIVPLPFGGKKTQTKHLKFYITADFLMHVGLALSSDGVVVATKTVIQAL